MLASPRATLAVLGLTMLGGTAATTAVRRPPPQVAYSIVQLQGGGQIGTPGAYLGPADPYVQVSNNGVPDPSAYVSWTATGPNGYPTNPGGQVDANGVRGTTWSLPTAGPFTLTACVTGTSVCTTFTARVVDHVTQVQGDNQAATPGAYVGPLDPYIQVFDRLNRVVQGVPVHFTNNGLANGVTYADRTTDANGNAATTWTMPYASPYTLTACAESTVCTTFTARLAAVPTTLVAVSTTLSTCAESQAGHPCLVYGLAGPENPAVQLLDAQGTPMANRGINFVADSGGTVNAAQVSTNASGIAAVAWTFGPRAGTQHLRATVATATTVTYQFTATVTAPVVTIVQGNNQVGTPGQQLVPTDPYVSLADIDGRVIAGVPVLFTAAGAANGGHMNVATPVTTNASGLAGNTWFLPTVGPYTMTACRNGTTACATFTALVADGVSATITKTAGNNQSGPHSLVLSGYPTVRVTDGAGAAVAGATVTFTPFGTASVTPTSTTTNATGDAYTAWTLRATAGPDSLRACTGASGTICTIFSATATNVSSTGPIAMEVDSVNTGTTIARDDCLTIAAGENAAYECGDLRLVHALPATTTMNTTRVPTLFFNSRHAKPMPVIAAHVGLLAGTQATSLVASLAIAGHTTTTKTFAWDPVWSTGAPRRIAILADTALATGAYAYTLQVQAQGGGSTLAQATNTSMLAVVNRTQSPFGAGWWLDGLEQLSFNAPSGTVLWVGGDGSTRLYTRSTTDTLVYTVAPAYDRPDSLTRVGSVWRRSLGNGAFVEFDASGRHTSTVNVAQHVTSFAYTSGAGTPLSTITLPVPSGAGARTYTFAYVQDANGLSALSTVTAPPASATSPRVVSTTRTGHFWIAAFTDPDGLATTFGYDTPGRVTRRQNKLADTTYFSYDLAGGLTQSRLGMSRTNGAGATLTTSYRPAETQSLATSSDGPTLLTAVYTHLNGPRDAGDTTNFLLNRWGSPDEVVNALGYRTRAKRENAVFPALTTTSIAANGFTTRAYHNARALVDSSVAIDPYGAGCTNGSCNAVTRYDWHAKWNHVTHATSPTGQQTTTFYGTTRALPDSVQIGTTSARIVKVQYTPTLQVQSVTEPGGQPGVTFYDAVGNLSTAQTAMGFTTRHYRDALGRDTLRLVPTDAAQTDSLRQRTWTHFDIMDRVDNAITFSGAPSYTMHGTTTRFAAPVTADTLYTAKRYDAAGRLTADSVNTSFSDNGNRRVRFTDRWTYDAAGRAVTRSKGQAKDSMVYDFGGNLVQLVSPGGGGYSQTFDALNRVATRTVAAKTYAQERCSGLLPGSFTDPLSLSGCFVVFPAFPTEGSSFTIPLDVASFTYDAIGNMLTADNHDATIHRVYYPNGALKGDTSRVLQAQSAQLDAATALSFTYDLAGRRLRSTLPSGGVVKTNYAVDDGALSTVIDPLETTYRYVYTVAGRVDSLVVGMDGVREKRWYDADGRQYARRRVTPLIASVTEEGLRFDAQGRVVAAWRASAANQAPQDSTYIGYSSLGAVLVRERKELTVPSNSNNWETEEFRVDGFGNVLVSLAQSRDLLTRTPQRPQYSIRGALFKRDADLAMGQTAPHDLLTQGFDAAGNTIVSHHQALDDINNGSYTADTPTRSYYGNDGRVRAVQRYGLSSSGTWEEYRYDALGRRVLVFARAATRPPGCDAASMQFCTPLCPVGNCESKATYAVWDGAQLVQEDRRAVPVPGGASTWVGHYGIIQYVHGVELDHPLATISSLRGDVRVLNPSWRGGFESSVNVSGAPADCSLAQLGYCDKIAWPVGEAVYQRPVPTETTQQQILWAGSLLADQQDGTGQLYRRNRYYDPDAGRFTQEDPIGLAGGMNLYGFAGGDPVNFSDPFGLCKNQNGEERPCTVEWSTAPGDHPNKNVLTRTMAAAHALADAADVDLVLSSGLRPGDPGNHGRGLALDISAINGIDVGQDHVTNPRARTLVNQVQSTARTLKSTREDFGPAGLWKAATPGNWAQLNPSSSAKLFKLQYDHLDHVHISIQP